MLLALLILLQDAVEMKEFKTSYQLVKPASYTDHVSWPVIVDVGTGKDPVREPDCFVLAPGERKDEAYVLACLMDLKTKYRVHPEKVVVRGGAAALTLATAHPDFFAGCVLYRPLAFQPVKKMPPCVVIVAPTDPDRAKVIAAAMVMKKWGVDVEVREADAQPGLVLRSIGPKLRPRGDLPKADEFQRQGRYLDASLLCIDLLENTEVASLARTKLKSIEGAAIMEIAKVEIAMADRKYKDAILRCREAARQFAWVPPGERIRKRLAELELRPEVKRALETED
ncbi:MAG: hypothetical protein EHM91_00425 [Planctomycetota bacterium]|nr:MAG: hypothetical protein EHM91_00425 [Planctomycetota bacterium]